MEADTLRCADRQAGLATERFVLVVDAMNR